MTMYFSTTRRRCLILRRLRRGFLGATLNALAMEPLGHVAGTASSAIGFFTTVCGTLLGFLIGQLFDGSVVPLTLAYVVFGLCALGIVALTDRQRLTD